MPSKKFYIFAIILISFTLLSSGILNKKFRNINENTQKASVVEVLSPENTQTINFDPNQSINQDNQIQNETLKTPTKEDEVVTKKKVITYTCPTPEKEYDDMSLLAVGQTTKLSDTNYTPKNLVEVDTTMETNRGICIAEETSGAFKNMANDALKDGYTIKISSGFRNYDTQKTLFDNASKSDKENAIISIAKPGYSEHQLGTTIDVTGASIGYSSANGVFDNTPEDLWLRKNAYLYGFIQSYPLGKEDITGYKYEPWHYRYVGIDNAKEIIKNEETLNQFLTK